MPNTREIRMTNLFLQLGLDASEEGIQKFIAANKLDAKTPILEADIWTPAQQQVLREMLCADANWSLVVDQLSEALRD